MSNVTIRRLRTLCPQARRAMNIALMLSASALGSLMGGCWTPGGNQMSTDSYTYFSTTYMPQTVTVIDTRTDQPVFSVDIPVGKELVMRFFEDGGTKLASGEASSLYPDSMKWDIWPLGREFGNPTQSLDVPPFHARRVDVTLRDTPETPKDYSPAVPTIPAPQGTPGTPGTPGSADPSLPPSVPAPQDAPSAPMLPAPPAPPGPGSPAGVGDGQ